MLKFAELKAAVKEINSLGIDGVDTIRTVGIKRDVMESSFLEAVEKASDAGLEDSLSNIIIEVNNAILDALDEKKEEDGTDKKPAAKGKKPAAKGKGKGGDENKKPAAKPKDPVERSCYGHVATAQSGMLDEAFKAGGTVADIMEEIGVKRPRVMGHLKHLKEDCGLTVIHKPDKKDDKSKDFYKIKEKTYRKP